MINKTLQAVSLFISLFFVAGQVNAATVSFNSALTTVNPGDSFSLTIQGSGFDPIVGGGLNLSFDASVLQVNSVTINQSVFEFYLGGGVEEGILDNSFGSLLNTSFNTFMGASGNFDIMDISFTAIGAGTSNLVLSESLLWVFADTLGGYYGDQVAFESAAVTVSAVPVPAALWLFGTGLIGLAGVVKRQSTLK
ncbi:MAG: PEP-CTERM sorting domain-containing protein [Gammaproteobacteria bacterium]|nr:PEP-CTERM sorting domain-containing protein [Gammaproteobacteria bacterium]